MFRVISIHNSVNLQPSDKKLPVGQTGSLTLHPFGWWIEKCCWLPFNIDTVTAACIFNNVQISARNGFTQQTKVAKKLLYAWQFPPANLLFRIYITRFALGPDFGCHFPTTHLTGLTSTHKCAITACELIATPFASNWTKGRERNARFTTFIPKWRDEWLQRNSTHDLRTGDSEKMARLKFHICTQTMWPFFRQSRLWINYNEVMYASPRPNAVFFTFHMSVTRLHSFGFVNKSRLFWWMSTGLYARAKQFFEQTFWHSLWTQCL